MPTALASENSATPTMNPAPPRRFCHAGWRDMPATNLAKMNATSEIARHTANCQPNEAPTPKVSPSGPASSCIARRRVQFHTPRPASMAAVPRLTIGISH